MPSDELPDQVTMKLDAFAATRKPVKIKPAWVRPELADLAHDVPILALDQSLSSTGWAELRVTSLVPGDHRLEVHAHGTLKTSSPYLGHVGTLAQMRHLTSALDDLVHLTKFPWRRVICEQPPITGFRKESSLLAAAAVELAVSGTQVMVQAQHAKYTFTGDKNATKATVKKALAYYLPEITTRDWNEHSRDAVLLGLTYLKELTHDFE